MENLRGEKVNRKTHIPFVLKTRVRGVVIWGRKEGQLIQNEGTIQTITDNEAGDPK